MTWTDGISAEEKDCVEQLKERTINDVTPKMLEDPTLFYRFSKARNFNLKQAEYMLRKNIAARKEHNADTILDGQYKMPEVLEKYSPSSFIGFDKEGHPVRYVSMSDADVVGLVKSCKFSDLVRYNIFIMEKDVERLKQQSEKLGKQLSKVVYIYDFSKFSFANATNKEGIKMAMLGIQLFQDNYPERIESLIVINTSTYFTVLFSIIKSILATAVIEKMHMFGTDGWKEELLKKIDAEVLPAFLGGNRTDPDGDPYCKSFIVFGQKVPEHYYLQKSNRTLHQEPGVKKLKVCRFGSSAIPFDVNVPGSLLEWEFETKSKDIGFGLYFKENSWSEEKLIELIPKQRIDPWVEPETGMLKCEKPGLYTIVFDNSYSWIYGKEIYYRAKVVAPNELKCV